MRAAVYDRTAPQGISVVSVTKPQHATHGKALVRVMAAGVNPVDAKYVFGDKLPGFASGLAPRFVQVSFSCPAQLEILSTNLSVTVHKGHTAGFDFSGVVEESSSRFKKGDSVFGIMPPFGGSFAEFILCPENQVRNN